MTTKIINPKISLFEEQNISYNPCRNHVYGKPSKPRYQQPSMYEILSWNQNNQQTLDKENNEPCYCAQNCNQFYPSIKRIQSSLKKLPHCKSLPAEQFMNQLQKNQLQKLETCASKKKVKLSDVEGYLQSSKPPQMKAPFNTTKNMPSQNNFRTGLTQQSLEARRQQKSTKNINFGRNQGPAAKQGLQKKSIPYYSDPQKKPRYMEKKKNAIEKFIESQNFDQQEFDRMKKDEIKKFKQTTRDLSNTAFLTYFNKPPFQNYGRENKQSIGVLYGDYMYSHNVYPHTGDNKPVKQQTYISALSRAKSAQNIRPHLPLSHQLEESLISKYLTLTQVYPKNTSMDSIPINNKTVLQSLPRFNLHKDQKARQIPKYSHFMKSPQNDYLGSKNQYLGKQQIPKFFSNKEQMQGKQIQYLSKIPQTNQRFS